ncbi:hypothetical protein F4823DRAFT_593829 [Ustulina deusta]|nr:hypothetical protein F4823DRAFT_593829 [Ustulina deusta]
MLFFRLAVSIATQGQGLSMEIMRRDEGGSSKALFSILGALFIAAHIAVIIIIFLYLQYTVSTVFPILAIVESRPRYELLPLQEGSDIHQESNSLSTQERDAPASAPLASSLKDLHHLVKRTDRFWLRRRGLFVFVVYNVATAVIPAGLGTVFSAPSPVLRIVAALLAVQLNTVWVHVIITTPKAKLFWKRILDFRTVFKAAAPATMLYCAATEFAYFVSWRVLQLPDEPLAIPGIAQVQLPGPLWKAVVCLGVYLSIQAFVCAPTLVALTRIQASLLPEDEETVVSVDRTFGVKESDRKDGLSVVQAWSSFSGRWMGFYVLSIKIFFLKLGVALTICGILGLEFLVFSAIASRLAILFLHS